MLKRLMLATTVVAAFALVGRSAEAAFTNAEAWTAQLQAGPNQTLAPFPSYSLVTQDAFGTVGPTGFNTSGQLSGRYGCDSRIFPCSGAYRLTYELPFAIVGFRGDLVLQQAQTDVRPPLDVPLTRPGGGYAYTGFYGDLFDATSTIAFVWQPGLLSTDDFGTFTLSSAQVVLAPVPEPASALLLGGALLGAGLFHARPGRSGSRYFRVSR